MSEVWSASWAAALSIWPTLAGPVVAGDDEAAGAKGRQGGRVLRHRPLGGAQVGGDATTLAAKSIVLRALPSTSIWWTPNRLPLSSSRSVPSARSPSSSRGRGMNRVSRCSKLVQGLAASFWAKLRSGGADGTCTRMRPSVPIPPAAWPGGRPQVPADAAASGSRRARRSSRGSRCPAAWAGRGPWSGPAGRGCWAGRRSAGPGRRRAAGPPPATGRCGRRTAREGPSPSRPRSGSRSPCRTPGG